MRGTLNAHKVFKGTIGNPGYLSALDVDDKFEGTLRSARDQIRKTLRQGMSEWEGLAKSERLVERRHIAQASRLPPLRPRFRMQGSSAYHTLNAPAHIPPQEVDLDDGVYLPTSFVANNGLVQPLLAARSYIMLVETALEPICERNGWTLDRNKPTCVRIRLDGEAHIDLALYAIPDEDFAQLTESARAQMAKGQIHTASDDFALPDHIYKGLRDDHIMLARRDGWIESDPRKIEDWFQTAIREHGEIVRRLSRYQKGWRDQQWLNGGPSSIALMACVVTVFDELKGTLPDNRDDLAIQAVASRLPELFSGHILNPVLPDQQLDSSWSPEDRHNFVARAADLKAALDAVLDTTYHKSLALAKLHAAFGERIPDDEHLIEIDSEEREVLAYEPARVAAPFVPRTTSG